MNLFLATEFFILIKCHLLCDREVLSLFFTVTNKTVFQVNCKEAQIEIFDELE